MGIRAVPTSEGHREDEGGECSILQNMLGVVLFVRGIIPGVLFKNSNRLSIFILIALEDLAPQTP